MKHIKPGMKEYQLERYSVKYTVIQTLIPPTKIIKKMVIQKILKSDKITDNGGCMITHYQLFLVTNFREFSKFWSNFLN